MQNAVGEVFDRRYGVMGWAMMMDILADPGESVMDTTTN